MSNPIGQVSQQAITTLSAPGQLASGAEKVGNRNGVQVAASNVSSPIPDNVEEVSMGAAKFKKFDEREVSKAEPRIARILELIRRIEQVDPVEGVDDFKNSVASNTNRNLNRKDFQQQAENNFEDVFHQYVALFEAADAYEAVNGEGTASEIYAAADELKNNNRQAILIGLNLTEEAASVLEESNLDAPVSEIRQEYFDHVQDHTTLEKLYQALVERHGAGNFEDAVEVQLRLLSADLACLESSAAPERLMAVLNDMAQLKVLVGVHENCMETQEQIGRQPHNLKVAADELMARLLGLVNQQWITEADFTGLADKLGVTQLQSKIFFMNKTAETVNLIPAEIFSSDEAQLAMLGTIKEVQDALVIEEEGGNQPVDDNYATVGEVTLDLGILQDIAAPMGINIPGAEKNIIPGVIPQDSSAQAVQTEEPMEVTVSSTENDPSPATAERRATKRTAESSVDESSSKKSKTNLEGLSENVKPSAEQDVYAERRATKRTAESSVDESSSKKSKTNLEGLSANGKLRAEQDVYLEKAAKLYQQKGEKYVVDSSLDALKYSLNRGPDNILASLQEIAKNKGGAFAKKLEIAITPEGSDKALKLIPPGEELKGVADLEGLVKTAITVLEEHFETSFKNFNLEEIEKELASLKESISDLDSKMTSKKRGRSKGVKQFDQLEYSRKFNIRADQIAGVVEASLDATEVETASPVDQKKSLLQFDKTPIKGTADYVAAKVLGQVDGEHYGTAGELIKDIRSLASLPSELDKLSGYIDYVIDSKTNIPLLSGSEALIREQIQSLRDNKVPHAVDDSITRTSIPQRTRGG